MSQFSIFFFLTAFFLIILLKITICWKRFAVHTFDIDGFESTRPPRYKDMGKDLRICCTDRLQLLQRIGTHHDEITAATRISSIVRKHRQRIRNIIPLGGIPDFTTTQSETKSTKNSSGKPSLLAFVRIY